MDGRTSSRNTFRRSVSGFTLVELMIALVLGLLVSRGVIGVFLSNQQTYRANENLARIQENARSAYEWMSRAIREAGGIPCSQTTRVANVLNNASNNWWSNWSAQEPIRGYTGVDNTFPRPFGSAPSQRVAGTEALVIRSATGLDDAPLEIKSHNLNSAVFHVTHPNHDLNPGNIVLACDFRQAAIFQVTNANANNRTIVHQTGGSVFPGNCSKQLGFPVPPNCGQPSGNPDPPEYPFTNGFISRLSSTAWYIGNNPRGGTSLYRIENDGNAEEFVDGVTDMQLRFLRRGAVDYVDASQINDWSQVVAVRVNLIFETSDRVGTDGHPIRRNWFFVAYLRNST